MLLSACNHVVNSDDFSGTSLEMAALLNLPRQLYSCGKVTECHALLTNLSFIHKSAKSGVLMKIIEDYQNFDFCAQKLEKLKSLFYLIHCEPDLIKGIISEETGQSSESRDFSSTFGSKTGCFVRSTFYALLNVAKCVDFKGTKLFAVSLENGAVILTDFDKTYQRLTFPSLRQDFSRKFHFEKFDFSKIP